MPTHTGTTAWHTLRQRNRETTSLRYSQFITLPCPIRTWQFMLVFAQNLATPVAREPRFFVRLARSRFSVRLAMQANCR